MEKRPLIQGDLLLDNAFLSIPEADRLYQILEQQLNWRQDRIRMFGRLCLIPRVQCFQGEPGIRYKYSNLTMEAETWHPELLELKQQIESVADATFNSVLINHYRNGKDSMGWHSDDETELGHNPVIASLSLGQPRRFLLRHRYDKSVPRQELLLNNGSLLIMAGETQHYWHHSVPKTAKEIGGRINLTFRLTQEKS